jgi:hypothetical protein
MEAMHHDVTSLVLIERVYYYYSSAAEMLCMRNGTSCFGMLLS